MIGGSFQGKAAYAKNMYPGPVLDGKKDEWTADTQAKLFLNVQEWIRRYVADGTDAAGADAKQLVDQLLDELLAKQPTVVTMDEVGCGIVPLDRHDRDYRDLAGYVGQRLAAEADQVVRMICGIPVVIKSGEGRTQTMDIKGTKGGTQTMDIKDTGETNRR